MKLYSVILAAACLSISVDTLAQMSTPEAVAREIVKDSPKMKTLRAANEASALQSATEGNLPDPELEGEYLFAPADETNRWGLGLSWGLDWPGVYAARKNVSKAEARALDRQSRGDEKALLNETRQLILDYILQAKQIEAVKKIIATTDSISAMSMKAHKGGEMTMLDINKLKIERATLNGRLTSLYDAQSQTVASLSETAGKDATSLLETMQKEFPEIPVITENDVDRLIENSPELAASEAEINVAKETARLAARENLPGLTIGYRHAFEDGTHFNGATLGISIPLFSGNGKRKAASASLKAAEIAAEEQRVQLVNTTSSALKRLAFIQKEIGEMAPTIEDSDNQALLLKAYKSGVITLIDYLNERNYFLEAALSLTELRHAAASSVIPLLSNQ